MRRSVRIPSGMLRRFEVFRADLETVFGHWLATGEETAESLELAREGLRRFVEDRADPDAFGLSREARLGNLFAHFREMAVRVREGGW